MRPLRVAAVVGAARPRKGKLLLGGALDPGTLAASVERVIDRASVNPVAADAKPSRALRADDSLLAEILQIPSPPLGEMRTDGVEVIGRVIQQDT